MVARIIWPPTPPQANAVKTGDNTNIFGQSVGGGAATQAPFGAASMSSGHQLPVVLNLLHSCVLHVSVSTTFNLSIVQVTLKKFVRYLTPELFNSCIRTHGQSGSRLLLNLVT